MPLSKKIFGPISDFDHPFLSTVFIIGRMEVLRFDFNGSSGEFKRTPQGSLRLNAYLTKAGIFQYEDSREYRSDEEVFPADSLESLKAALSPIYIPLGRGQIVFCRQLTLRQHIIGIAEGVERDGPYLKGSLIIFHEEAIKAIESGERKEIPLGYKCRLEQVPGSINGEAYDARTASYCRKLYCLGPKGWGRAGPDCAIRIDSTLSKKADVTDTIRLDGVDIVLSKDSITTLLGLETNTDIKVWRKLGKETIDLSAQLGLKGSSEVGTDSKIRVNSV